MGTKAEHVAEGKHLVNTQERVNCESSKGMQ